MKWPSSKRRLQAEKRLQYKTPDDNSHLIPWTEKLIIVSLIMSVGSLVHTFWDLI